MTDLETWRPEDDELVRTALMDLRADVDALAPADPRFVRARGETRRRHRRFAWAAGAAAAVAAVAAIGFSGLGRPLADGTPPASSTTTASPGPGTYLDQPSALPIAAEWQDAFGIDSGIVLLDLGTNEAPSVDEVCPIPGLPAPEDTEEVRGEPSGFRAVQLRYAVGSPRAARSAFGAVSRRLEQCRVATSTAGAGSEDLRVWSYRTGDERGSGWIVLVRASADVARLDVVDRYRPRSAYTADQVTALARIARERLARYGSDSSAPPSPTSSPSGSVALDEDMPVVGTEPLPSSDLFVAASQWSSQPLTGGAATRAGMGDWEGQTDLFPCDEDTDLTGQVGLVGVTNARTGHFIGHERVRLFRSQRDVDGYVESLRNAIGGGCSFPNGTVEAKSGDLVDTYRLDTHFKDGSATLTTFVGLTAMTTPNAITTVVITEIDQPEKGFDELERLLDLARQK
jgi:hypothetical protein